MSVIQKIRTRYAKLAGGVIAIALVAFILMDALSSRTSNLFGNDDSIVKVEGEKVDYKEYTQRTNDYEVLYGANQQIDENFRSQINTMAMDDLVKEIIIKDQAEKIGLTVTDAERKDMIYGQDPDQGVKSYQPFTNPNTKTFDPQYVKLFEEQVDQLDPTGKARIHWETYKGFILRNALVKKYTSLLSAAAYSPSFVAKQNAKQQAQMANIQYVSVDVENIPDDQVTLTDEDYKNYMTSHKDEFSTKEKSRNMQFVAFPVLPAKQDTARALGFLNTIKEDFIKATDNESFVNRNSEESFKDIYQMKEDYESRYVDSIFALPIGGVLGPVYEGESYKLVKMLDKEQYPDSVWCRHILINTAQNGQVTLDDTTAKNRIDSIAAAIKAGASFADMVAQYSDDAGSKEKAGEYTFKFNQKNTLTKPFGDFIFNGKKGETKIVKVESGNYSGYHLIEILQQGPVKTAVKTATVSKALFAGDETENEIYARANEFAGSSTNAAMFDTTARNSNLQVQSAFEVKVNDFSIYNIGPAREIIRWAYNAEVGDVSQVFAMNGKYVVAKLTEINKPGTRKLDDKLKADITPVLLEKKKAEMTAKKYADKKSLTDIAYAASKEIQTYDSLRGNSSFSGPLGYVPKVIGYIFSNETKLNTVSKPIIEQGSIFFVTVTNRYQSPQADESFAERENEMLQSETKNAFSGQELEEMKKRADIKYNVDNF